MQQNLSCEIPSVLDELFGATCHQPAFEAARVIASNPESLSAQLRLLLNSERRLHTLPISRHPNGFTKITLYRNEQRTIRLHIWNSALGVDEEVRIHGHAWSMASIVLRGQITHTAFDETSSADGELYHRYKYTPGTSRRTHTLEYDCAVYLKS